MQLGYTRQLVFIGPTTSTFLKPLQQWPIFARDVFKEVEEGCQPAHFQLIQGFWGRQWAAFTGSDICVIIAPSSGRNVTLKEEEI